jgi:serine/threonine-protein kinase
MSPEQALGRRAEVDLRSDVYALGATLYELLAGEPPFRGTSGEVLVQVIEREPEPLRKRNPEVPRDVETIVLRCLQKRPQDRYPSAWALAEDLRRVLAGEPIAARREGALGRIIRIARKHKLLAAAAAAAAMAVLGSGIAAVEARRHASARSAAAQRFGAEAKEMEGLLRMAYLAPLHDVRREKALVRARMAELRHKAEALGPEASAAGAYALGRAHLALRELPRARTELERAWDAGYREPEVGRALGEVLGALYQEELQAAERIATPAQREERIKQAQISLRDRALGFLRQGPGAMQERPAYGEALIAYYDGDTSAALANAGRALAESPLFYEARSLEGEVRLAAAYKADRAGQYAASIEEAQRAGAAWAAALEVARSDPAVHEGICQQRLQVAQLEQKRGGPLQPALQDALDACARAQQADPERGEPSMGRSRALFVQGMSQLLHGEDPRPVLRQAAQAAEEAAGREGSRDSQLTVGNAWLRCGSYELWHGLDPKESFEKARKNFEEAIALDPGLAASHNSLGYTLVSEAEHEKAHGGDPLPLLDRAIESYRRAVGLDPKFAGARVNLCGAQEKKGRHEWTRGLDPRASFDAAAAACRQTLAINPNMLDASNNLSAIFLDQSEVEAATGVDPRPALEQAVAALDHAIQVNPKHYIPHLNQANLFATRALFEVQIGESSRPSIAKAIAAAERALKIEPTAARALESLGEAWRCSGEEDAREDRDPRPAFGRARDFHQRARKANPNWFTTASEAAVPLAQARWERSRKHSPLPAAKEAEDLLARALEQKPDEETLMAMAEVRLLEAQWLLDHGEDARNVIEPGLDAAVRARGLRPKLARAQALEGALRLLEARLQTTAERKREVAQKAAAELDQALGANRWLEREFKPLADQARLLR